MADIVLFPSADLHVSINLGAPRLRLRVAYRDADPTDPTAFTLRDVTFDCGFAFFAPYQDVGRRFDHVPNVDGNAGPNLGVVRATDPGVYLFQVAYEDDDGNEHAIVGRLQVHRSTVAWWFGNRSITTPGDQFDNQSITTAVDPFGHAQPSIYAQFSDDTDTRTDLIGDITGHGYVRLTSADTSLVTVEQDDRLRGHAETTNPVGITGSFLGATQTIGVRVIDYGKQRDELEIVRASDLSDPTMYNLLFLAEGFELTDEDRAIFDKAVTKCADKLFHDSRHEPYPMLVDSFNVFKHFSTSRDSAITVTYRVTDAAVGDIPKGRQIPSDTEPGGDNTYSVAQLVARVGPPRRDETTAFERLVGDWRDGSLPDFEEARVDRDLVEAWRGQHQHGIFNVADTLFGLCHGLRLGDRTSVDTVVSSTSNDNGSARLRAFIAQLYTFWPKHDVTVVSLDRRRHPVQRLTAYRSSPGNAVMRYIGGLRTVGGHLPIGQVWVPDPAHYKASRGLVVMIAKDSLYAAASIVSNTMIGVSVNQLEATRSKYTDTTLRRELVRTVLAAPKTKLDELVDTVAHELGHAFNLGDEYESVVGDYPHSTDTDDLVDDNLTSLDHLRPDGAPATDRHIDPAKVKWFELPRMIRSSRLVRDTVESPDGFVVPLEHHQMVDWKAAKKWNKRASLLRLDLSTRGQRLPLGNRPRDRILDLIIVAIDIANATITLGGPNLPPRPLPVYTTGSVVYLPTDSDKGQTVVKPKVYELLRVQRTPLNAKPDHDAPSDDPDTPIDIPGLRMPCHPSEVIGVYEGGMHYAGGIYRPAGECKMRNSHGKGDVGEFCFVCKWLIVNRVDAGLHAHLDDSYPEKSCGG